jgi:hypothetical protein
MSERIRTSEIARRLNVERATVSNWKIRYTDFPTPTVTESEVELFDWDTVKAWLDAHGLPRKNRSKYPPSEWELWRDAKMLDSGTRTRMRLRLIEQLIKMAGRQKSSPYLDLAEQVMTGANVDTVDAGGTTFRVLRRSKRSVRISA